jgi:hypothetical protein
VAKKREDMLKQNIQELNFELDKLRDSDIQNASFMTNNSYQQTIISELELKVQSLEG